MIEKTGGAVLWSREVEPGGRGALEIESRSTSSRGVWEVAATTVATTATFADPLRCVLAEEFLEGGKAATDDDEIGFDDTRELG